MNRKYRKLNKLSRTYQETKSVVGLREGFGVVGAVLALGIAVEDVKIMILLLIKYQQQ